MESRFGREIERFSFTDLLCHDVSLDELTRLEERIELIGDQNQHRRYDAQATAYHNGEGIRQEPIMLDRFRRVNIVRRIFYRGLNIIFRGYSPLATEIELEIHRLGIFKPIKEDGNQRTYVLFSREEISYDDTTQNHSHD